MARLDAREIAEWWIVEHWDEFSARVPDSPEVLGSQLLQLMQSND